MNTVIPRVTGLKRRLINLHGSIKTPILRLEHDLTSGTLKLERL